MVNPRSTQITRLWLITAIVLAIALAVKAVFNQNSELSPSSSTIDSYDRTSALLVAANDASSAASRRVPVDGGMSLTLFVTADGSPVRDAVVGVSAAESGRLIRSGHALGTTDGNGELYISVAGASITGDKRLFAYHASHGSGTFPSILGPGRYEATLHSLDHLVVICRDQDGEPVEAALILASLFPIGAAFLCEAPTGAPNPSAGGHAITSGYTDASGRCALRVGPGEYQVYVLHPHYVPWEGVHEDMKCIVPGSANECSMREVYGWGLGIRGDDLVTYTARLPRSSGQQEARCAVAIAYCSRNLRDLIGAPSWATVTVVHDKDGQQSRRGGFSGFLRSTGLIQRDFTVVPLRELVPEIIEGNVDSESRALPCSVSFAMQDGVPVAGVRLRLEDRVSFAVPVTCLMESGKATMLPFGRYAVTCLEPSLRGVKITPMTFEFSGHESLAVVAEGDHVPCEIRIECSIPGAAANVWVNVRLLTSAKRAAGYFASDAGKRVLLLPPGSYEFRVSGKGIQEATVVKDLTHGLTVPPLEVVFEVLPK